MSDGRGMGKHMGWQGLKDRVRGGFLARLARDTRANTIAIVAAALIPLCGMIGGGFDLSRMYIVKTRLQHACDAGALAGRKSMGGGTWAQSSYMPRTMAERFFDANIASDAYGSNTITKSYSENAGKVTGTASAILPMTLMRVLGKTTETLTVTCESEMRLPNTDVMFVLDITGSMNCAAGDTSCSNNGGVPAANSKIGGLKTAVKCFYEIVARLDTNANCDGGAPSGGTGSQVQVRFGFVPYANNVNVGKLLPTSYMADTASYDTRQFLGKEWTDWTFYNNYYRNAQNNCSGVGPSNTADANYRANPTMVGSTPACRVDVKRNLAQWKYAFLPLDVRGLKNGTGYNASFTAQIGDDGTMATIPWSGCIEERQTVQATSYNPIPSGAKDLDIDLVPSAGDETTRWKPSLPDAIYERQVLSNWNQLNAATVDKTSDNYIRFSDYNGYYCPTEARKLQQWNDATAFSNYVDSFVASGNTYHDIGMIWGARLMSPTGIFASENAYTPQGGEIERHLIFMTDGDSTSAPCDYNAYGLHFFDKRQTNDVGTAGECFNQRTSLSDQINARLEGLCVAIRNKNITLWVVSFGGGVNAATETRLQNCASPGRYFKADDPAALQRTFKSIADQISALRLIK